MGNETEVPVVEKPDRLFRRQNWPVLVLAAGTVLFLFALVLWRWPLTSWRRQRVENQLAAAAQAVADDQLAEAYDLLTEMAGQVWRIGNRRGEAWFLLGYVNNRLADQSTDLDKARGFYRAAVACLKTAQQWRLPVAYAVAYTEELGHALQRLERAEAADALHSALDLRRALEAALARELASAALRRDPPETAAARRWLEHWGAIPNLPDDERQAASAIRADLENGQPEAARDRLAHAPRPFAERSADEQILRELLQSAASSDGAAGPEAFDDNRQHIARILDDLARFYAERTNPDYARSAEFGAQLLAIGDLPVTLRDEALRRQAEVLLSTDAPLGAQKCLIEISGDYVDRPMVTFLLARSYFAQASQTPAAAAAPESVAWWRQPLELCRERGAQWFAFVKYLQAATLCQRILADPAVRDESHYGQALLMLGSSQRELGRFDLAEESYERVINGFPGSPFERAARFMLADALRRAGSQRAIPALRRAVEASKPPAGLKIRYLPESQLHAIFTDGWRDYLSRRDLRSAVETGLAYQGYAPPGDAELMVADAANQLARDRERQAAAAPFADAAPLQAEARLYYRLAGEKYAQTAEARRASLAYGDFLWQAALAWFEGQAYDEAIAGFQRFLPVHGGAERDFLARLYLARGHMALQQFPQARLLLEAALVDHPRAPDRFNGRLQLARCYQELARQELTGAGSSESATRAGELFTAAEGLLLANIDGQRRDLEPTAWEWRRSLFLLGELLHETARYDEAIARLNEAVRRYPEDSETTAAHYLIADAYLKSAKKPAELLAQETAPRGQALLRADMAQRLESAEAQFGSLMAALLSRQSKTPLRPTEESYLRNCYFGIGEVAMAIEDWPAAIEAYTTAANRYQDRPDALFAYLQIANAYWRLGKDGDARGTLRQARWILRQMDEKVFDGASLTKEQWTSRLDNLVGGL